MRSSGTSAAAATSPSSRPPRVLQRPNSAQHHHRSTSSTSSTSSGKGVSVASQHVSPGLPERRPSDGDSPRTIKGNHSVGGTTLGTSGSSRSNDLDIGPAAATPTTTPTTHQPNSSPASRFRPALRLHSNSTEAVPQLGSVSASPQRRVVTNPFPPGSGTNSSITTPSTGTSEGSHFWKSSPQRLRATNNAALSVTTSSPITRANTEDLSRVPELVPEPPPKPIFAPPRNYPRDDSRNTVLGARDSPKARTREHRSYSQKAMLSSALEKANTAVQLDNAENYEGAMEAYGDACVLLGQVMMRAGGDEDRRKLQRIVRHPIYSAATRTGIYNLGYGRALLRRCRNEAN